MFNGSNGKKVNKKEEDINDIRVACDQPEKEVNR